MARLTLRDATGADSAAVRALVGSILAEYGLPAAPADTDADLADIAMSYRDGRFWVLEQDGAVVGSCGLMPLGDGVVELRKMYLEPRVRGQGWGRRLLEHAIAAARAAGYADMQLETASVLSEAIELYRSAGFRRLPRAPHAPRCDQLWSLKL